MKSFSKIVEQEVKGQKGRFLAILFGTLGSSLLRNLLESKDVIRDDERTITAGQDF